MRSSFSGSLIIAALAFSLLACGGGGGGGGKKKKKKKKKTPSPTATVAPTPAVVYTPSGPFTPFVAETASPEEVAYYNLKKKAEDLVLAKSYEEALPVLQEALETNADDHDIHFLLLLTHGNLEVEPTVDSEAYKHAKRVIEIKATANEAQRARSYIASAHSEPEVPRTEVGSDTIPKAWAVEEGAAYELTVPCSLLLGEKQSLGVKGKRRLWEMEVYPEGEDNKIDLPAKTQMVILAKENFLYSKLSWRGRTPTERKLFDSTMYNLGAFFVEVTGDGEFKGKKGWIVNQMDRFISDDPESPWGVWTPNRLLVPKKKSN